MITITHLIRNHTKAKTAETAMPGPADLTLDVSARLLKCGSGKNGICGPAGRCLFDFMGSSGAPPPHRIRC